MQNAQVIGGMYIGPEVATSPRNAGKDVVVAELAPRQLARFASLELSELLHKT